MFYLDSSAKDLRRASWTGSAWAFETLDGQSVGPNGRTNEAVGQYNAVVIYNGGPHVFYHEDLNNYLRHAWFG
ncbi:MAG: hypothetical protein M5U31_16420 [Acidimicrobiia bacterium]|nr:hypothetical protein [Acidimicrobiia bacterium]